MPDTVSREVRSRMMSGIRSTDTKPELLVRRGLHRMGYRYKLHDRSLPGRPDLVFPRFRAIIQVHGCYWHGHECPVGHSPGSNTSYWSPKIQGNVARDERNNEALTKAGWRLLTVWECALRGKMRRDLVDVLASCAAWLDDGRPSAIIAGR